MKKVFYVLNTDSSAKGKKDFKKHLAYLESQQLRKISSSGLTLNTPQQAESKITPFETVSSLGIAVFMCKRVKP